MTSIVVPRRGRSAAAILVFSFALVVVSLALVRGSAAATATTGSLTMHVADLDGASIANGRLWTARVTILIRTGGGNPVSGSIVSGNWSNGASGAASCTTASSGQCVLSKSGVRKNVNSVTFTVTSVAHNTLSYDASANVDPDGDSNGTTITIGKP